VKKTVTLRPVLGVKLSKRLGISLKIMHINIKIRCVVCVLLLLGGTDAFAQRFGSSSSWGNNGLANDYYYGDRSAFQMDDNMFTYGSTATQNMASTSSAYNPAATFETAASHIVAGSTLADFQAAQIRKADKGNGWAPPVAAPIGDGWDVMLFMLLLAVGYGVYVYRRRCKV